MEFFPRLSPRLKGKVAAIFYLVNIAAGASALGLSGRSGSLVLVIASLAYVAVTALFFDLFRPVSSGLSALAALCSLIGCLISAMSALDLAVVAVNPLGFFGLYCLLIGYLVVRSGFLPSVIGLFMALGGLSWMTFFSASLTARLAPYNMAPGILAEVTLTIWLLTVGVDDRRWHMRREASTGA
jgi:hypothetical protein